MDSASPCFYFSSYVRNLIYSKQPLDLILLGNPVARKAASNCMLLLNLSTVRGILFNDLGYIDYGSPKSN